MSWEKVKTNDSTAHDFTQEGKGVLEGKLVHIQENVGPNSSKLYTIEKGTGEVIEFWGTTVLDNQLAEVQPGTLIRIEYLGKAKGKRGAYKNFDVAKWIDVTE